MTSLPKPDLFCLLCQDIFKDPVLLPCSHNFCKNCLQGFWFDKEIKECPVCKKASQTTALKTENECRESQKSSAESEPVCVQHSEQLKLFCQDHQQPVCVICRDSKAHSNHKFQPVDEAAQEFRQELQGFLTVIQEKWEIFDQVKENYHQTAKHIQVQTLHTENLIKDQFKRFHQFLHEEQKIRISALREEETQKTHMMKEKITSLEKDIAALSETIRAIEKDLRAADVPFLLNYQTALEKIQLSLLKDDHKLIPGALIDQANHLGNLSFNIWNKMKEMVSYSPVILDPNTAHPDLLLSDDLTDTRHDQKQKLPANPERISSYLSVLGSEGFDSQTHSWEVEVGDSPVWALGVAAESEPFGANKSSKVLKLSLCDGEYKAESSQGPAVVLRVKPKIKRVKVHLDCEKNRLSFMDPETNTNIHTFTHTFTERLFPYFNVVNRNPLKIIPVTVSVGPRLDKQ